MGVTISARLRKRLRANPELAKTIVGATTDPLLREVLLKKYSIRIVDRQSFYKPRKKQSHET